MSINISVNGERRAGQCASRLLTCKNYQRKLPPLPGACREWANPFPESNCVGMSGAHQTHADRAVPRPPRADAAPRAVVDALHAAGCPCELVITAVGGYLAAIPRRPA